MLEVSNWESDSSGDSNLQPDAREPGFLSTEPLCSSCVRSNFEKAGIYCDINSNKTG